MSNLARTSLVSLAVVFALTACLGASALAAVRTDGSGALEALAPKGSHKPNPNATPVPTPQPTPRPTATPKATPKPTPRPPTATTAPKPMPAPESTPVAAVPAVPAVTATPEAALPLADGRRPRVSQSILAIGPQSLANTVGIVALAGVVLFGAWLVLGRRRSSGRRGGRLAPEHAAATTAPAAPAEQTRPRRERQEPARAKPASHPRGDRRSGHLDDVFAGSKMRRVVRQDHVRLLNVPSEAYGTPLTELGSGREVKVLEQHDTWARVRTPWGEEGWVPSSYLDE